MSGRWVLWGIGHKRIWHNGGCASVDVKLAAVQANRNGVAAVARGVEVDRLSGRRGETAVRSLVNGI